MREMALTMLPKAKLSQVGCRKGTEDDKAHLLVGGELPLEENEEPPVAEVVVGRLLALLQTSQTHTRVQSNMLVSPWTFLKPQVLN